MIPFVDLIQPHLELEEELMAVVKKALRTAGFIGGPMVEEFERDFARFCEVKYCIGVNSGTDALRFALMAAGVKAGDTVITVPNTFIATTEAISQAGAQPEFVDIDPRSCNMDPGKLREYLETRCDYDERSRRPAGTGLRYPPVTRTTKSPVTAVIPVHLYGQPAEMDPILELADRHGLIVIEDACQAHGAEYFSAEQNRWRRAGSMGKAAAFSFYPGKNLGACGEGGAVTTDDEQIARKVQMLRDHGQAKKYYHEIEGYNGRLDAIQAGLLTVKLGRLPEWNARRREIAARYRELFGSVGDRLTIPDDPSWARSIYHLYVIRVEERDALRAHLSAAHIGTGTHYPIPLHMQKAYKHLGYRAGAFPVSEKIASEVLSLPMYPQLQFDDQILVACQVQEFLSRAPARATA